MIGPLEWAGRRGRVLATVQRVDRDDAGYARGPGWTLSVELEPRDVWIGLFWRVSPSGGMVDVYVCLLPCLPLHLTVWRGS